MRQQSGENVRFSGGFPGPSCVAWCSHFFEYVRTNIWRPGLLHIKQTKQNQAAEWILAYTQLPVRREHCFRLSWLLAILVLVSPKRKKKYTSLNKHRCSWTALMTFRGGDLIESLELPEAQSLENCVLECLSVLEHVFHSKPNMIFMF